MTTEPHWDHFDDAHGRGIEGVGNTVASAFGEAGRALTALVTDLGKVRLLQAVDIRLRGHDLEPLLVDWLNVVIGEMAGRDMVFGDFEVYVGEGELVARIFGEPLEPERHHPRIGLLQALPHAQVIRQGEDWVVRGVVEVSPAAPPGARDAAERRTHERRRRGSGDAGIGPV